MKRGAKTNLRRVHGVIVSKYIEWGLLGFFLLSIKFGFIIHVSTIGFFIFFPVTIFFFLNSFQSISLINKDVLTE